MIKKPIILILLLILFTTKLLGQILHPVHWSYGATKINKTEAVLFIKATIDDGWHIYSVNQKEGGPQKTGFAFAPSKAYQLIGEIKEPTPIIQFEKVFKMDVHYFEGTVIFQQKFLLASANAVVHGKVSFMTCNDQKCLPPDDVNFKIIIR